MSNYYLIAHGQIVSGPHGVQSDFVRRLTSCGNPELLGSLAGYGLVPEVRASLAAGQTHGAPVLAGDGLSVSVPAVVAPPPPVPASVTMRQARLALLGAGALAGVDAAIASLPEPQRTAAKITWEYSTEVQRHNGLVSQLGPALGLTEAQIDALFRAAAAIP